MYALKRILIFIVLLSPFQIEHCLLSPLIILFPAIQIVSSSQISNHFSSNQHCIKPNWPADFVMIFLLGKIWLESREQKSKLYQFSRITAPHTVTSNWMLLEWRCCHISEGISFRFWPKEEKSQKWAPLRPLRFFNPTLGKTKCDQWLVCVWVTVPFSFSSVVFPTLAKPPLWEGVVRIYTTEFSNKFRSGTSRHGETSGSKS